MVALPYATFGFNATIFYKFLSVVKMNLMNRVLLFVSAIALLTLTNFQCRKTDEPNGCYKGRLEIQGICGHYTVKVLQGNIDPALIEASWTDPNTGKQYTNVFGLDGTCNFPQFIREGDEFYFKLSNTPDRNCFICLAIYPTPAKKLAIQVVSSPCN